MSKPLPERFAWTDERPRRFFLACLALLIAVCLVMVATGNLVDPLPQFDLGAQEILRTHHIAWDFLPIGYAALLGWAFVAGSHWGLAGMHVAALMMNAALLILTFLTLRALLREACSDRFATLVALLISLYPELVQGIKKISDTNATFLTILLAVVAVVKLRRSPRTGPAVFTGIAFAAAALVRPNLAVLPLLLLWALRASGWRSLLRLGTLSIASAIGFYCMVTTAVHGRPFLPHNGAYNLYAGANPHTEVSLRNIYNGEPSTIVDMADHGLHVKIDWLRPANLPGLRDPRDAAYESYYREQAHSFIRRHPATMIKLSALKLVTLLRPEGKHYHFSDKHKSHGELAWLTFKGIEAMVVPLWLGILGWSGFRKLRLGSSLIRWTVLLYVLPFVLVNADPRFRTALDLLLLADMARMIYLRRCQTRGFASPCVERPGW